MTPEIASGRPVDTPDMQPFDVRGPLPSGTVLLEASAGTGKTWTIASLVARYVVEAGMPLDRMLVVTFSRAASRELRERVRTRLVEVEAALAQASRGAPSADVQEDALLDLLVEAPAAELVHRLARVREALVDFDAATIATTHTFCQTVLRSLGVAGDNDAGARLVEDLEALRAEVVDDLFVRGFAGSDDTPVFDRAEAGAIATAVVSDACARLEPRHPVPGSPSGRRRRFAEQVRIQMQLRKRRLGILSYDDLLSRLADALEPQDAPARRRMRDRWDLVLVDEFQDTDPVQWNVLHRAFSGHSTMVLIGDPKQAIYAFRGGDVHTYLSARRTAGTHLTLDTNHRSDSALLDRTTAFLRGAELGDGIVVRDVRAAHAGSRLTGLPTSAPFRLRMVSRGADKKPLTMPQVRDVVAPDLAADVAALLASDASYCGRPIQPGDIAVLAAKRAQLELVQRALAAVGVHGVIAGSGNVVTSAAGDDWLCLLEAMEQPSRADRIRSAALTSFFGFRAEEVASGGERLVEDVGETLRSWADLLRLRGVAAVFEVALSTGALSRRVLDVQDGERLLTDLRHLSELLHLRSTRDQLGLTALLAWLREQREEDKQDMADEQTRRLDSDAAAVQLLTIHGSKGLQFPVVYLPFVADHWERDEKFPLFHDDTGERCLDIAGDEAAVEHVQRAKEELSQEQLRLLYVAMTRAQSHLVTWWFPTSRNTAKAAFHRLLMGRQPGAASVPTQYGVPYDDKAWELAQAWEAAGGPVVEKVALASRQAPVRPTSRPRLSARSWTRRIDRAWRRTSYTGLSSAAAAAEEPVVAFGSEPEAMPKDDETQTRVLLADEAAVAEARPEAVEAVPSPMGGLPVGATFGSLVHAVLEHADPAAPDHGGDFRGELLAQVARFLLVWPVDVDPDALADALVTVCKSPLGPLAPDRTLRGISFADRLRELDFELPLAGGDDPHHPRSRARLSDLAPLLREHLPEGDPLLPYADVLSGPGHEAQLLHGYLGGSVDLVFRVDGRYVVVDYKTNWLGPMTDPPTPLTSDHYAPSRLADAMTHSSYPLQALLYAVVLHRFLRWRVRDYDPDTHLGGVVYLYLRGMCGPDTPVVDGHPCGVFTWEPPSALVQAVSDLLDGAAREVPA